MSTRSTELTDKAASGVLRDALDTVSGQLEGVGSEIGDQLQGLAREMNNRHLAVRGANGQVILRIPLLAGVAGGIGFFMFVPIRRAVLLMVALLFSGIHFSVEENEVPASLVSGD